MSASHQHSWCRYICFEENNCMSLSIISQAPAFRTIFVSQFLLKAAINYLLGVSIEVHLLRCQVAGTNSLCELFKSIPSQKFCMSLYVEISIILACIDWSLPSALAHCKQLFLETVLDMYLFQHVQEPTQCRNSSSSLLDLSGFY